MVEWYRQGKLPIHPPERSLAILPAEPSSSKSGGSGRRDWWFLSTKCLFHTRQDSLTCCKILRHGASGFTSPPKEGVLWICIALKNPSPPQGLNPRTLGSMTIKLTITRQVVNIFTNNLKQMVNIFATLI
jgi:hypothetical protein